MTGPGGLPPPAEDGADLPARGPENPDDALRPAAPSPAHVWVPGHWRAGRARNEWVPGRWLAPEGRGSIWVSGHWSERDGRRIWVDGHWE
jgi:hypothetical protein